ncbi:hypothetical protein J2Y67_002373 [Neobacillus niacini]|nr:hypothetical protein [Neobacillus niacini]
MEAVSVVRWFLLEKEDDKYEIIITSKDYKRMNK